jgi:hypothetical protein
MKRDTRKPSGGCRSAPGGPTPAGRTRRSRRAEHGRKQGPARPCAPQSARPDQSAAPRPRAENAAASRSAAYPDVRSAKRAVPKSKPAVSETLSLKGALALAKQLEKYWHDQGYPAARFWVEPIGERFEKIGTYELYRVASNLVDGLPPRYLDQSKRTAS